MSDSVLATSVTYGLVWVGLAFSLAGAFLGRKARAATPAAREILVPLRSAFSVAAVVCSVGVVVAFGIAYATGGL